MVKKVLKELATENRAKVLNDLIVYLSKVTFEDLKKTDIRDIINNYFEQLTYNSLEELKTKEQNEVHEQV